MFEKVKKYINQNALIKPGDKVIAAVSGGPDSMALLHMLLRLQPEMDLHLVAAHLNHGLRPEADTEEEYVQGFCAQSGMDCYSRRVMVKEIAGRDKKTLEEAGRDSRYEFFNQLSEDLGGALIATAHHQDDRAEGVLLNLVRGTGIKGLRSVMPCNGLIIRPLLALTRDEIMTYLRENVIAYCIDTSNNDPVYLRNRIRLGLLPYLQNEFNPSIVKGLNQLAELAADENDWMERHCDKCWGYIAIETDGAVILRVPHLAELHTAMQRRVIIRALACFGGEAGWTMDDVAYVQAMLSKGGSSKVIKLKKGLEVRKVYNELHFTIGCQGTTPFCYEVAVPGIVNIEEIGQSFDFSVQDRYSCQPGMNETVMDYDIVNGEKLVIRSRQPGDYFYPAGMTGKKKLKEFFIDIKVPQHQRSRIPLLAGENGVVHAIIGYRLARQAMIGPDTRRVLVVKELSSQR